MSIKIPTIAENAVTISRVWAAKVHVAVDRLLNSVWYGTEQAEEIEAHAKLMGAHPWQAHAASNEIVEARAAMAVHLIKVKEEAARANRALVKVMEQADENRRAWK